WRAAPSSSCRAEPAGRNACRKLQPIAPGFLEKRGVSGDPRDGTAVALAPGSSGSLKPNPRRVARARRRKLAQAGVCLLEHRIMRCWLVVLLLRIGCRVVST